MRRENLIFPSFPLYRIPEIQESRPDPHSVRIPSFRIFMKNKISKKMRFSRLQKAKPQDDDILISFIGA